jgi:hypothetical protein
VAAIENNLFSAALISMAKKSAENIIIFSGKKITRQNNKILTKK